MKIYYDIIQGSPEWFALRQKKMTGSHATAIAACGKGLDTYTMDVVKELFLGRKEINSKDIDRGNRLEPIARQAYEFETGREVLEVGFIQYNDFVGISPDGLVGDEGGIEIKAKNNDNHLALLMGGAIDSGTKNQIQMNLLVSGRAWWDFVSYNPNFKKSIHIERVYPDLSVFAKLSKGFAIGEQKIKSILSLDSIRYELGEAC